MKLHSTVVGIINGSSFTAFGEAEGDTKKGLSSFRLRFSNPIHNFIPMLCKSWSCKNHSSLLDTEENHLNAILKAGENIRFVTEIEYPYADSRIRCTGVISRPDADTQCVDQTRLGHYTGPIDIVEQIPFVGRVVPLGPGRAMEFSTRRVKRSNGEIIAINYTDTYEFPTEFTFGNSFNVNYGGKASWLANELTLALDTEVSLSS